MKKIIESKVPLWMMSASRIQLILNIENRLVAKFIERMGFYEFFIFIFHGTSTAVRRKFFWVYVTISRA